MHLPLIGGGWMRRMGGGRVCSSPACSPWAPEVRGCQPACQDTTIRLPIGEIILLNIIRNPVIFKNKISVPETEKQQWFRMLKRRLQKRNQVTIFDSIILFQHLSWKKLWKIWPQLALFIFGLSRSPEDVVTEGRRRKVTGSECGSSGLGSSLPPTSEDKLHQLVPAGKAIIHTVYSTVYSTLCTVTTDSTRFVTYRSACHKWPKKLDKYLFLQWTTINRWGQVQSTLSWDFRPFL